MPLRIFLKINVKNHQRTSLVTQWMGICLANARDTGSIPGPGGYHMQRAAKPMHHNYWAYTEAHQPQSPYAAATEPVCLKEATAVRSLGIATKSSPHSPQLEKAHIKPWRTSAAKKKIIIINISNHQETN